MFIEPNAFDRFVIWDNILDSQHKRQILRLVMPNSETQKHMKLQRSYQMSDDTKSLVLQGMGIYSKSGYFESKVYPKYVNYVKKIVNQISHYELLNSIIPEWIDSEFQRLENTSKTWAEQYKKQHSHWHLSADVNTISGRIAYYVCNHSHDDTDQIYKRDHHRDLASIGMHPGFNVRKNCIEQREYVDSSILNIGDPDKTTLRNTIFKYSFTIDDFVPDHYYQCNFDKLPVWLQYMILFDPLPIIKNVEHDGTPPVDISMVGSELSQYTSRAGTVSKRYL